MHLLSSDHFYVYILTNSSRSRLSMDVTGDLSFRLFEHEEAWRRLENPVDKDLFCIHLVWWEHFTDVSQAINRKEELKRISQKRMQQLIETSNPEWRFLNQDLEKAVRVYL